MDFSSLVGFGASGAGLAALGTGLLAVIILIAIWKLIWYGLALYKAIQLKQRSWFVALFVCAFLLGDLGILAIIYLLLYKDKKAK